MKLPYVYVDAARSACVAQVRERIAAVLDSWRVEVLAGRATLDLELDWDHDPAQMDDAQELDRYVPGRTAVVQLGVPLQLGDDHRAHHTDMGFAALQTGDAVPEEPAEESGS